MIGWGHVQVLNLTVQSGWVCNTRLWGHVQVSVLGLFTTVYVCARFPKVA